MNPSTMPATNSSHEGLFAPITAFFRRSPGLFVLLVATVLFVFAGYAYGMWEKNQYLVWLRTHPGQPQVPGPLTAQAKGGIFVQFGWCILSWIWFYQESDRQRRYRKWEERAAHPDLPPQRPLPRQKAAFFVASGLVGLLGVLHAAALEIKVFVWEGNLLWFELLFILSGFIQALGLCWQVVAEKGIESLGLRARRLPSPVIRPVGPEALGRIREALAAHQVDLAIRIYGDGTGADPAEARAAIMNLKVEIAVRSHAALRSISWWRLLVLVGAAVFFVVTVFSLSLLGMKLDSGVMAYLLLYGLMVGMLLILGLGCLARKLWGIGTAIMLGAAFVSVISHFHLCDDFGKARLAPISIWACVGSIACVLAIFASVVRRLFRNAGPHEGALR